jgi:putative SOS response-associated peptidase YedK
MDHGAGRVQLRMVSSTGQRCRIEIRGRDESRASSSGDAGQHPGTRAHIEHGLRLALAAKQIQRGGAQPGRRVGAVSEDEGSPGLGRPLRKSQPAGLHRGRGRAERIQEDSGGQVECHGMHTLAVPLRTMCYSALVRQDLHEIARRFGAEIAYEMFTQLFRRRREEEDLKVARALEQNFMHPANDLEQHIKADIEAHRARRVAQWEKDLFVQKKRLADAERSLSVRETHKARDEVRIASKKIETNLARLSDVRRTTPIEEDDRIFPLSYAPVIARIDGKLQIVPMRYTCRLAGRPASYDTGFPGTYIARRDSLDGFWSDVFGRNHAIMIISGFFENVPRHLYERRALRPGERPTNVVLQFNPRPAIEMYVACVWDHWTAPGARELWSFAAVSDDPPAEIAATGHQRSVIPLKQANLAEWLSPRGVSRERLQAVLSDREAPYYEHRIAA